MTGNEWIFDSKARTNPSFGCKPEARSLQDLLDCGVILIDKPPGPSSHQLAAWVRSLLGIKRIGHGGTLDPFATGLLTLLCGRSTKITSEVLRKPKSYISVIRFRDPIEPRALCQIVEELTGEIYNVPPKESAVKIQVRIRKITSSDLIESDEGHRIHLFSLDCEAGTYVRTFVKDLGLMAGNKCELLELHRSSSGNLQDSVACTMHQLADAVFMWREHDDPRGLRKLISPVEVVLSDLPNIVIKDGAVSALSHGAPLARPGLVSASKGIKKGSSVLISSLKGEAVAIGEISTDSDKIEEMKSGQIATASNVIMRPGSYPQTWSKEQN